MNLEEAGRVLKLLKGRHDLAAKKILDQIEAAVTAEEKGGQIYKFGLIYKLRQEIGALKLELLRSGERGKR
jgi:hypothetical protein